MSESYQKLRPYWEAWKSDDPADTALRETMVQICKAVTGDASAIAPPEAIEAARRLRDEAVDYLKSLPNYDPGTNQLRPYRGISDWGANQFRRMLRNSGSFEERAGVPVSYSTSDGAALRFATKGKYFGVLYQRCVPLDSVAFVDRGYYTDGNNHLENEIVICHCTTIAVQQSDVLESKVQPHLPYYCSKAGKQKWEQERKRLEDDDTDGES